MTLASSRSMSRGFRAALIGLALTILGYLDIWEWPAWPAFFALDVIFGSGSSWIALSPGARNLVLVALIAFNTACWGAAAWTIGFIIRRIHGRDRDG